MVTCVLALGCLCLVSAGLLAVEDEVAFLRACSQNNNHTRVWARTPQLLCPMMKQNCSTASIPLAEALTFSWPSWALILGVGLYGIVDMPLQALARANIGFFYSQKTLASNRANGVRTTLCSATQSHSDGVDRLGAGYSFFTITLGLGIMTSLLLGYAKVPSLLQSVVVVIIFVIFMVCIQFLPKPPSDQVDLGDETENTVSAVVAADHIDITTTSAVVKGEEEEEADKTCAVSSKVTDTVGPPTVVVGGGAAAAAVGTGAAVNRDVKSVDPTANTVEGS